MAKKELEALSIEELRSEIRRRQQKLQDLDRKRKKVVAELARIDAEISALSGQSVRGPIGRGRPQNKASLADTLVSVLDKEKPMSVGEAVDAVLKAGYKTNSRIFRTIVNQTLLKDKRVKQVGRAQYVRA